jgi:hypothetical protein
MIRVRSQVLPPPGACAAGIAHRVTGGLLRRGHMRYSAIVLALSMMTAVVPQSPAQTQPATPPPAAAAPAPPKTAPPPKEAHPKASGAAKGAAVGAMGGNAAKGAVIGAGHSRREERRAKR